MRGDEEVREERRGCEGEGICGGGERGGGGGRACGVVLGMGGESGGQKGLGAGQGGLGFDRDRGWF